MFSNQFGTHKNVECGLVRLLKLWKKMKIPKDDEEDNSDSDSEDDDDDSSPDEEDDSNSTRAKTAPIPLQSVSIVASVVHAVAQVELTQVYVNKEDEPIEAIYYFPVDSNGSVTHFHAELEGRTITGVVKPEEEAKAQYEKAVEEEQTAFLVESNKPDIFKVRVGFLKPGCQVKIVIGWVTEVKNAKGADENEIQFFIPTTVAPRYISPAETDSAAEDLKKMTFSETTPAPLSLTVNVAIQGKIKRIQSLTHAIRTENLEPTTGNWNKAVVTLDGNVTDMDRDFVLLILPEEEHEPRLYSEKIEDTTALMVHLIPSFNLDEQKAELIFVLDRSGSMDGTSMELAKKALLLFLHSLPSDCYFNIVGFGSSFEFLFPKSVQYDAVSLKKAISLAKNLDADLGGTEILKPLKAIFAEENVSGYLRQLFILTDGEVSDTDRVIGICKENAHNTRVFALGIGNGASHALVEGIAAAGGGTANFVSNNEAMDAKVLQQLKNAIQPSLTDVKLKWIGIPEELQLESIAPVPAPVDINRKLTLRGYGKPTSSDAPAAVTVATPMKKTYWEAPEKIPPIFDGSQLLVFGVFSGEIIPSGVEITAESPDGPLSIEIKLSDENNMDTTGGMIHKLAAIKVIKELEMKAAMESAVKKLKPLKEAIISIACKNGLASKYTSFVAVDSDPTPPASGAKANENWIMQPRYVPSQMTYGYGGSVPATGGCRAPCRKRKSLFSSAARKSTPATGGVCAPKKAKFVQTARKSTGGKNNARKMLARMPARRSAPSTGGSMSSEDEDDDEDEDEDNVEDEESDGEDKESDSEVESSATQPKTPQDFLHKLVSTQSFDGSFPCNQNFSVAIGKTLKDLLEQAKKGGFKQEAWATAIALIYLAEKLGELKESWELVELKGKKWLQKNFASQMDSLLAAAKEFLN